MATTTSFTFIATSARKFPVICPIFSRLFVELLLGLKAVTDEAERL